MTSHDIIRQMRLQDCELGEARKALRKYRSTDKVAKKAFNIINNVISGSVPDVHNSIGHVIKMLWNHDLIA